MRTTCIRIPRIPLFLLLCAAACVCSCSRQSGESSSDLSQTGAIYHVALVDSFARHVTSPNGKFDAQQLKTKKYLFVFFAAHWSESSRRFTARLIEFYNGVRQNGDDDIGVIFVSVDRSSFDMSNFMRDTAMPWPGVRVNTPGSGELRKRYAGPNVPCLVLLDENDNVLASSYDESGKYFAARAINTYQKLKNPAPKKSRGKQSQGTQGGNPKSKGRQPRDDAAK